MNNYYMNNNNHYNYDELEPGEIRIDYNNINNIMNNDYITENYMLKEEIRAVHATYLSGMKIKEEEINDLKNKNYHLEKENIYLREIYTNLLNDYNYINDKLKETKKTIIDWIGRTLKFEYLFKQMKKIGLKQSGDIFECFEDIEVPEVSIDIRDKFIPTEQTDNTDYILDNQSGVVEDIIQRLDENYIELIYIYTGDMRELENKIIIIQKIWRGYSIRKDLPAE